jgi:transposase
VTGIVDLTRDNEGNPHARLLDVVPGRTGTAYAGWLKRQDRDFIDGVQQASLDPFRGYANAIRDELPDAVPVLDAFHVVKVRHEVSCLRMEVRDLHRLVVAAAGLKLRAA